MEDFFKRISHPALTDIAVDWGSMRATEVFPREMPDLFVGRPVILTGRFQGEPGTVRVTGQVGVRRIELPVVVEPADSIATHNGLPSVWARSKITDLSAEAIYQRDAAVSDRIRQVALDYGLMSSFTAFVAVDSTRVTEGVEGTTVPVAVPVPEGVKYETTVPNNDN
jgi:Ca-activated chloride channel family protein